jgi:hypothetical protein
VSAGSFLTILQIVIPSALFGALFLGGASSSVARWLGRPRRPFRLGRRRGIPLRPATRLAGLVPVQVTSTRIAGTRRPGAAGPDRRAA